MTEKLAMMAELTGHDADAAEYAQLAEDIKAAFNAQFYNATLKRYAADGGTGGTTGATQVAQALALDAGLVPDADREAVLDYLVENIYAFNPSGDGGPHLSGGTIGLAPTVRALTDGGRSDVLWDVLQSDAQPSYGFFLQPTTTNPDGFTTIGERWNRGTSRNHMILAQIEEWFHEGLAGIREAEGSLAVPRARHQARRRGGPQLGRGQLPQPAGPHPLGVEPRGEAVRPARRDPGQHLRRGLGSQAVRAATQDARAGDVPPERSGVRRVPGRLWCLPVDQRRCSADD